MHIAYILQVAWICPFSAVLTPSTASKIPQLAVDFLQTQYPDQVSPPQLVSRSKNDDTKDLIAAGIESRDDEDDDLRIRGMEILTIAVPIWRAAGSLEFFYSTVFHNALGPWASLPLQSRLVVQMGCLQLTMTASFGFGVPRGIPWSFVRNFSRNMVMLTRLGFIGTYVQWYSSVFGGFNPQLGVQVQLEIRRDCSGPHTAAYFGE